MCRSIAVIAVSVASISPHSKSPKQVFPRHRVYVERVDTFPQSNPNCILIQPPGSRHQPSPNPVIASIGSSSRRRRVTVARDTYVIDVRDNGHVTDVLVVVHLATELIDGELRGCVKINSFGQSLIDRGNPARRVRACFGVSRPARRATVRRARCVERDEFSFVCFHAP